MWPCPFIPRRRREGSPAFVLNLLPLPPLLPFLLLAGSIPLSTAADQTAVKKCYNSDGTPSKISWPCVNSTDYGHSTCCQPGATCYSNGVCLFDTPRNGPDYERVGCTDPTWSDPACLDRCRKIRPAGACGVRPCDGILQGTRYCCDDGSDGVPFSWECCGNDTKIFKLGTAVPSVLATMPLSGRGTAASQTAAPGNGNGNGGGPNNGNSGGGGGNGNGNNNNGGGGGNGGANADAKDPPPRYALGLGVGLGIGLPLAAAVLGGLAYLVWRRRHRHRLASSSAYSVTPLSGPAGASFGGNTTTTLQGGSSADASPGQAVGHWPTASPAMGRGYEHAGVLHGGGGLGVAPGGVGGVGSIPPARQQSLLQPAQLEGGYGGRLGPDPFGDSSKYMGHMTAYIGTAQETNLGRPPREMWAGTPRAELDATQYDGR